MIPLKHDFKEIGLIVLYFTNPISNFCVHNSFVQKITICYPYAGFNYPFQRFIAIIIAKTEKKQRPIVPT